MLFQILKDDFFWVGKIPPKAKKVGAFRFLSISTFKNIELKSQSPAFHNSRVIEKGYAIKGEDKSRVFFF